MAESIQAEQQDLVGAIKNLVKKAEKLEVE